MPAEVKHNKGTMHCWFGEAAGNDLSVNVK